MKIIRITSCDCMQNRIKKNECLFIEHNHIYLDKFYTNAEMKSGKYQEDRNSLTYPQLMLTNISKCPFCGKKIEVEDE